MAKTFTYDSSELDDSALFRVRFLIGDTIKSSPLFDDNEINHRISVTPDENLAGAELLEAKARQFARLATFSVGDVSKQQGELSQNMLTAAKDLRKRANTLAKPFFGGLTKSGNRTLAADTDANQPNFRIGQDDNPTAVQMNNDIRSRFGETT